MQREMRRRVGQIEEEGFVALRPSVLVEESNGFVGEGVGGVEAVFGNLIEAVVRREEAPVALSGCDLVEAGGAGDQTEVSVEAPLHGPVLPSFADVPFARHVGAVSRIAQFLGDGGVSVGEEALVAAAVELRLGERHHVAHAHGMGIAAGEQGGAGGAAAGVVDD